MESENGIRILTLIVLLLFSGFFSSAETALVSCSRIRMRTLADEGNKNAAVVLRILEKQDKMLSAILIGNNFVNTLASSMATVIAYSFGGAAVGIATFIITLLILIFGEITPKTMATKRADSMALHYAKIVRVLMVVLTPIIAFVNVFSSIFLRILGVDVSENGPSLTESELRTIVDVSHEEGVIEQDEKEMINNVFDFGDAKAKEVMVPRVHVIMAEDTSSYEDLLEVFRKERFTRIPIYKDSIDNVIGMVNMKDLLLYDDLEHFNIYNLLRKPFFTFENKPISDLLLEMKKSTNNMAIVLDEYGELAGIITLEDIIEEIVGEVQDEYDDWEVANIKQVTERVYDVKGYISLHDLNDAIGLDLDSEEFDSIGGLVIDKLGRLPKLNEQIVLDNGIKIKVINLNKKRIEAVRITLPKDFHQTSE
ncbi:MAG: HlyC/CorC family transporter [Catenisphaera adipataccumulans]|jgi:putative hemolysin|uniref:HlyC/CorC family transporter n=1 Tax=Catenisphaera adipataccumulans TaxID=700500 RepID=UPI003D8D3A25